MKNVNFNFFVKLIVPPVHMDMQWWNVYCLSCESRSNNTAFFSIGCHWGETQSEYFFSCKGLAGEGGTYIIRFFHFGVLGCG
jgi:hypothetical protein